jgi:hypothetical protein
LRQAVELANEINNTNPNRNEANTPSEENAGNPGEPKKAFGGSMYAASATPVVFGEAGPEIATFTPLTKANTLGFGGLSPYRGGMGAGGGGGGGLAAIRIMLSPGLIAQIIDSTLDHQSKVFLDIINARE